jgi:hypothetical protein
MYRVCRDPLLHVQARLWPPDVLFWETIFRPKNFQKKSGNHANTNIKMVWFKATSRLCMFVCAYMMHTMTQDHHGDRSKRRALGTFPSHRVIF